MGQPQLLDTSAFAVATGEDLGHVVQFYEGDAFLVDTVARFVGAGLGAGDTAVIIATRPHRKHVEEQLRMRGLDVSRAREQGRYIPLDAAETLARFMRDGQPDQARFDDIVGGIIEHAAHGRQTSVRAFGEMVALLWVDGQRDAAIRLEALWNDLAKRIPFSLLCAYPIAAFGREADGAEFDTICERHARVFAAESYPAAAGADEQLRVITQLQQKARALEREVEERKAVEKALRRHQQELTDFFENAAFALHCVGPDGIILRANRTELALLGYAPDEYVGHHVAEVHVDQPVIEDILERLGRGETLHEHEARLRCKDGSIRHVLIDANVLWEDGKFVHTRCFTRDVTERKSDEAEREQLLAMAECARSAAEAANRAKDEFLSVVSHELRTPLASMLGWVAALKAGATGDRATRALATIERSGRAQAKLIDDLLDASRIITGRMRLDLRLVHLPDALRQALDTIRPTADAKAVRIEAWLDPTAGPVAGDTDRLQQIAWNLLSNAVKFTPTGGRVEMRLERREDDVRLVVRDTGRGISREFLPFISERFRQADSTEVRHPGRQL